jgi:predicted transcriptional regulator with HTH domain
MEQNTISSIFSGLITSQLRVKILIRLFLDPRRGTYLRELADDCSASPGHLKQELSQLTSTRLLRQEKNGFQINYFANKNQPFLANYTRW